MIIALNPWLIDNLITKLIPNKPIKRNGMLDKTSNAFEIPKIFLLSAN